MAQSQHNEQPGTPTLPPAAAQAKELGRAAWRPEAWAERTIARTQPLMEVGFGAQLMRRFDAAQAPGAEAATFAQRFMADTLQPSAADLVLALYAPPQRHVRAARLGALSWSGAGPAAFPTVARTAEQPMLPGGTHVSAGNEPLLSDLEALGWGSQGSNTSSATAQALHAAPVPAAAAGGHVSGVDLPAIHESEPTLRAATDDHERSLLPERTQQRWAARSSEAQPEAAAAPPFQTAATRPTGLIGGAPISPLQRMGIRQREANPVSGMDEQHNVLAPAPSGQSLVAPARSARTPAAAPDTSAATTLAGWIDTTSHVPTASDEQGGATVAAPNTNRAAATTRHVVGSTPASSPMPSAAEHAAPALDSSGTSAGAAATSRTTAEDGASTLAQHEDVLLAARPPGEDGSTAPTSSVQDDVPSLSRSFVPNNDAQTALGRQPDAHGTDTAPTEAPTSSQASEGTAGGEADVNHMSTVPFSAEQHNAGRAIRQQVSTSPASLAQRTLLPLATTLLQRHLFNPADASTTMPLLRTWRPSETPPLESGAAFAGGGASPEAAALAPLAQEQSARILGSAGMSPPAQGTVPSLARSAVVPPFPLPAPVEIPTSAAWEHHQRTQGAALLPTLSQPAASTEQGSIDAGLLPSTVGETNLSGARPSNHQPDQAEGEPQSGAVLRSFEPSFSTMLRDTDTQPSAAWGALPLLQRVLAPHTLLHAAAIARAAMAPTRGSSPPPMWPREIDHTASASTQQWRSSASGALPLLQRAVQAAPRSEAGMWERHAQPLGDAWAMGMVEQRDGPGFASSNRALHDRPAPALTLLQATPAGPHPNGRESVNEQVTALGDRNTTHAGSEASTHAAQQATPDLEALARQVYARLRRRFIVERERLGR